MNNHVTINTHERAVETGKVKWFDSVKGFGFVAVSGFGTDFLLHLNVLQSFGRMSIAQDASIRFNYEQTPTGLKIVEVIAVEAPEEADGDQFHIEADGISDEVVPARVKWFNKAKGYGFVNCYGCTDDVFVGHDVLKRSAMLDLKTGEALCIQVAKTEGRKSVYRIHEWA